ncbi:MAG: hypothetical protein ACOX2Q_06785 [Dehalobacterium sp.]
MTKERDLKRENLINQKMEKIKYEFMQEFGIMPQKSEAEHVKPSFDKKYQEKED